jgi:hypothetical protein
MLSGKKLRMTWRACPSVGLEESKIKYGNKRVRLDGCTFDSKEESKYSRLLKLRLRASKISDIRVHSVYKLEFNNVGLTTYEADFTFKENGTTRVIDVKGVRTTAFIIKKRLMPVLLSIHVEEIPLRKRKGE